jgi:hypothetical protein
VDLVASYSKRQTLLDDLKRTLRRVRASSAPSLSSQIQNPHVKQAQHRLPAEEQAVLAADYRTGASIKGLAIKYAVHRTTVTAILLRAGEPLRQRGLSEGHARKAAQLFGAP